MSCALCSSWIDDAKRAGCCSTPRDCFNHHPCYMHSVFCRKKKKQCEKKYSLRTKNQNNKTMQNKTKQNSQVPHLRPQADSPHWCSTVSVCPTISDRGNFFVVPPAPPPIHPPTSLTPRPQRKCLSPARTPVGGGGGLVEWSHSWLGALRAISLHKGSSLSH